MFGMVTATGIRILDGVDLEEKPNNLLIIAISIAFGMIPIVSQQFFGQLPAFPWAAAPQWHSPGVDLCRGAQCLLQWCSWARNTWVRSGARGPWGRWGRVGFT